MKNADQQRLDGPGNPVRANALIDRLGADAWVMKSLTKKEVAKTVDPGDRGKGTVSLLSSRTRDARRLCRTFPEGTAETVVISGLLGNRLLVWLLLKIG